MSDQEYRRLRTVAISEIGAARDLLERGAFWSSLEKLKEAVRTLDAIVRLQEED